MGDLGKSLGVNEIELPQRSMIARWVVSLPMGAEARKLSAVDWAVALLSPLYRDCPVRLRYPIICIFFLFDNK